MTRAEFIKKTVKDLWGVEITIGYGMSFDFTGCDGVDCPDDISPSIDVCNNCPFRDFWETEVENDL